MKVKKSEIQLLIAVIGVLIAVCTYFLVYSSFNEKSDALEAQNATLSSQVATLEILDQRKADYIEATEKMQSYITNFENRFPADILPEDSIMMVKTLEDYTRTEVANIAFGSEAEVVYTPAADAATTTADATATTDTTATDAAADTTAAAATTVASPVSTDGTADRHRDPVDHRCAAFAQLCDFCQNQCQVPQHHACHGHRRGCHGAVRGTYTGGDGRHL